VQVIVTICISKENGVLQHHVWDPGKLQETTKQQQGSKASKKQYKVWDLGGMKK
jgi:hypothetical protein